MGSIWFALPDITDPPAEEFLVGVSPTLSSPARTVASGTAGLFPSSAVLSGARGRDAPWSCAEPRSRRRATPRGVRYCVAARCGCRPFQRSPPSYDQIHDQLGLSWSPSVWLRRRRVLANFWIRWKLARRWSSPVVARPWRTSLPPSAPRNRCPCGSWPAFERPCHGCGDPPRSCCARLGTSDCRIGGQFDCCFPVRDCVTCSALSGERRRRELPTTCLSGFMRGMRP